MNAVEDMVKLVASMPEFYAYLGRAPVRRGEGFGCFCSKCGRDVAAPFGFEGREIWCLYCGIEADHIVLIETPYCHHRFTFGITRDEAIEEREAEARGEFYVATEARARRLERLIDLF